MTRKNLADVLLKILGVSMILSSFPSIIAAIALAFESLAETKMHQLVAMNNAVTYALADGFRTIIGLLLVISSRKLSEYWYKNENE